MKYRQEQVAEQTEQATSASLKVRGKWVPGILLDKAGNVMPFPCEVKQGETYIVEVDTGTRKRKPKEAKPTGPVQYQESSDQTGPKYVYKVSYCDVMCGWPKQPSFKGLKAFVNGLGSELLMTTRQRGSKLVHFEGPLQEVERIKAWAHEWVAAWREAHSEQ